jgi:hypothetical protein
LRPCDLRHDWRCGSARGQMQKLPAEKFHSYPSEVQCAYRGKQLVEVKTVDT